MSKRVDTPYVIPLPSDRLWTDAPLIDSITEIAISPVTLALSTAKRIVPDNRRRWALGIIQPSPASSLQVSPWPEIAAFPFIFLSGTTPIAWLKLFDYGPLVCSSWYAFASGAMTIRVVELLRKG